MRIKFYKPLKRSYFLVVIMSILGFSVFAQNKTVTGTVTDNKGNTLPGVNIVIVGTNSGVATDVDGKYSLEIPNGKSTIQVSSVGFATQSVNVSNRSVVNIVLIEEASQLEEVVITGYQTLRKKDITGAVTVIDAEDLKLAKSGSALQNLAGRAPGVNISTSGSPGDATTVTAPVISCFRMV